MPVPIRWQWLRRITGGQDGWQCAMKCSDVSRFSDACCPSIISAILLHQVFRQESLPLQFATSIVANNVVRCEILSHRRHWLQIAISFSYLYMLIYRIHHPSWRRKPYWSAKTGFYLLSFVYWTIKAHRELLSDICDVKFI